MLLKPIALLYRLPALNAIELGYGQQTLRFELSELGLKLSFRQDGGVAELQSFAAETNLIKNIVQHQARYAETQLTPDSYGPASSTGHCLAAPASQTALPRT